MTTFVSFSSITLSLLAGVSVTSAQTGSTAEPFEVASVKPTNMPGQVIHFNYHHGGVIAKNVSLAFLITDSFPNIYSYDQIINAPSWSYSARFDVEAKPHVAETDYLNPGLTTAERRLAVERVQSRLRILLAERFQLKAHRETREINGFALVVGKHGAKFLKSRLPDGSPGGAVRETRPGRLAGPSIHMPLLASYLGRELHESVVDKTGLIGFYSVALSWTPEGPAGNSSAPGEENVSTRAEANEPSIFTALQEQLGLRLVREKQQRAVLVVDHVEKPSLN